MQVTNTKLFVKPQSMENNMFKWYAYVVGMEDNRWPLRIMSW